MEARSEPTTCVDAEPFALRVTDDSMEPEFKCGCIIIVDPTGMVETGAYVIAEHGDSYIFRQLMKTPSGYHLAPLNDRYPTIELPSGIASVKGVVVQRAGTRRREHKRY
ncbi:MAG: S24 family peptidase [Gammaproteobacteria bacterium]